jgi:hypothetical protein
VSHTVTLCIAAAMPTVLPIRYGSLGARDTFAAEQKGMEVGVAN